MYLYITLTSSTLDSRHCLVRFFFWQIAKKNRPLPPPGAWTDKTTHMTSNKPIKIFCWFLQPTCSLSPTHLRLAHPIAAGSDLRLYLSRTHNMTLECRYLSNSGGCLKSLNTASPQWRPFKWDIWFVSLNLDAFFAPLGVLAEHVLQIAMALSSSATEKNWHRLAKTCSQMMT